MARPSVVERIVEAVSDGAPVDWNGASGEASTSAERERLGQLRILEEVARFHRASDPDAPTIEAGPGRAEGAGAWGPLELREVLGAGAFGRVVRAWDPNLQREVALKLVATERFRETGPEAFLREGRLLARVRHPNVVQVHGADVAGGFAGVWMELIPGRTLEAILAEEGTFSADEAARIGVEVCRGLAAVHGAGLVHRDVKASNVMRERGGRIVLMDLGAGLDAARETPQAGSTTGTPLYMAPEVLRGEAASARSDLYSVGVLLFRLVSGAFPVRGSTVDDLLRAHREGRRRSLRDLRPDLPPEFIRIVERATAPDPEARGATVGELQAALESLAGPGRAGAAAVAPARRSRLLRGAALAAGVVLLLAVAAFALRGRSGTEAFDVQAALYRNTERGRERLSDGDTIGTGDRLTMDFQSSLPVHVYVLNQDDRGNTYLLFPLPGLEPGNPVPGGARTQLPGTRDGRPQDWIVTSDGGRERFLVVASREPVPEVEQDLAGLRRPTSDAAVGYARLSEASERRLRGVGGIGDDATPDGVEGIFDRVERLGTGEERATGVWIRRVELRSR